MRILLEFSRGGLKKGLDELYALREGILQEGHTLTHDLVDEYKKHNELPEGVYDKLRAAISNAQCIIIEGSVVSLSLGYVLTEAVNLGKPVLFLVKKQEVSHKNRFVGSIDSRLLTYRAYESIPELLNELKKFLVSCSYIKTRFNLVLPNILNSYVTTQSQKQGISKTEYIIRLIQNDQETYHS